MNLILYFNGSVYHTIIVMTNFKIKKRTALADDIEIHSNVKNPDIYSSLYTECVPGKEHSAGYDVLRRVTDLNHENTTIVSVYRVDSNLPQINKMKIVQYANGFAKAKSKFLDLQLLSWHFNRDVCALRLKQKEAQNCSIDLLNELLQDTKLTKKERQILFK